MDRRFLVEAKSFVLSVLEGAFVLREVLLSKHQLSMAGVDDG